MASELSELQLRLNSEVYRNYRILKTLCRASDILFRSSPQAEKELSRNHFQLDSISWLTFERGFTVEQFIKQLIESLHNGEIDLQEQLLCCDGLPSTLLGKLSIQALEGINIAKLGNDYFLLWTIPYDKHPQPFILILNISLNQAYIGTTPKQFRVLDYSTLEIIAYIFERCLPTSITHVKSDERAKFLKSLTKSNVLAHIPELCPPHIGHYVLNNLSHLSRLEELGLLKYFKTIYRLNTFDYFGNDEKVICFNTDSQDKISYTESFETAKKDIYDRRIAAICSKDSSLGYHLISNVNNYYSTVTPSSNIQNESPRFTICVGVRGGTREAINLPDVVKIMVLEIVKQTNLPISIIVDGMSKSINNSLSTTRNISPARELEVCTNIRKALSDIENIRISSVIGMTLSDQLLMIRASNIALSHYGASTFKYLYLLGIPTIHHGGNQHSFTFEMYNKDKNWKALEVHMGESVISSFQSSDSVDHFSRQNYLLRLEACQLYFASYIFTEHLK